MNRRECKRIYDDDNDNTQDRGNQAKHSNHFATRVTYKITFPAADDSIEAFCQIVQKLLTELQQADDTSVILPWKQSDVRLPALAKIEQVPDSITKLRKYFDRVYLPKNQEKAIIYTSFLLGHDSCFADICEDLQSWLSRNDQGLFHKMLQAEDGKSIGWLLYSTREMDAGALADEIKDAIGIPVGLRWMTINTGTKKIAESSKTRALTVEISNKHKWKGQRALLNLYSRVMKPSSEYPNGIRMRFVELKKDSINAEERSKLDKLRHHQFEFLQNINSTTSYEVLQLDYSSKAGLHPTLRQMVMTISSLKDSKTPLFHSVDMDWQQDGFVFQYSKALLDEAETVLNCLLPLLRHLFPLVDVGSNFTAEAEERCKTMVWYETKNMIVDKAYSTETAAFEEGEELIGFEFAAGVKEQLAADSEIRPKQRFVMPGDKDSVSTFRSLVKDRPAPATQVTSQASSSPTLSSGQQSLVDERIEILTAQLEAQQNTINSFHEMMATLTQSNSLSSAKDVSKAGGTEVLSGDEQ